MKDYLNKGKAKTCILQMENDGTSVLNKGKAKGKKKRKKEMEIKNKMGNQGWEKGNHISRCKIILGS
jgi:hypothetical protein